MRELLDRLLEQNPDSENEIYDEIWGAPVKPSIINPNWDD